MSILAKAGAIWAAWKWVFILGAALAGSLFLNLKQYADCRVKLATAPLKAEVAGLEDALNVSAQLVGDASKRAELLGEAAGRASARLDQATSDYAGARRDRPITDSRCAPGPARVDATNRALGAQPPE